MDDRRGRRIPVAAPNTVVAGIDKQFVNLNIHHRPPTGLDTKAGAASALIGFNRPARGNIELIQTTWESSWFYALEPFINMNDTIQFRKRNLLDNVPPLGDI
jgi:hypothetical protein